MNAMDEDLREYLDEVAVYLGLRGLHDIVFLMYDENKGYIVADMSPQKTLVRLIDCLQMVKEECFKRARSNSDKGE